MGEKKAKEINGTAHEPDSDESAFFDLHPPAPAMNDAKTEDIMARLVSVEHLNWILGDHVFFHRFSAFLNRYNAHLIPTLIRYLEMRKAVKAIEYANAVARNIRWPSHTDFTKFSRMQAGSADVRFEDYASRELLLLCSEALPAFITHNLVEVVCDLVSKDITGQAIPAVRDLVGNLAEVFCLTDPSVHDNPIIYASEEFHRTTQYGTTYAIDRNCRFLQGPATDKNCTLRIARAVSLGRESNEIILNYRRDGTPFVNLLMCAPLYDDKGVVRYYIGAQVDVTGLVQEGMGLESFRTLLQRDKQDPDGKRNSGEPGHRQCGAQGVPLKDSLARLQELSMMFSQDESDVVNKYMRGADDATDVSSLKSGIPTSIKNRSQVRRIIGGQELLGNGLNPSQLSIGHGTPTGDLPGAYKYYILVRPYPSLQIIFVSPSLRFPGMLRTHLFSKLGGPSQTISALEAAFRDGAAATARILWLPTTPHAGEQGRGSAAAKSRWIRCTPLLGSDDRVGVWMVILIPVESENTNGFGRREHIVDMVDEVAAERKKLETISRPESRVRNGGRGQSVDGGFGLKKKMDRSNTLPGTSRRYAEKQLQAEYVRRTTSNKSIR